MRHHGTPARLEACGRPAFPARVRGGTAAAPGRVSARTLVAGVDSDRLYPLRQQSEPAVGIPRADRHRVIESLYGHDGFLIETEQAAALVRELTA